MIHTKTSKYKTFRRIVNRWIELCNYGLRRSQFRSYENTKKRTLDYFQFPKCWFGFVYEFRQKRGNCYECTGNKAFACYVLIFVVSMYVQSINQSNPVKPRRLWGTPDRYLHCDDRPSTSVLCNAEQ